MKLKGLLGGSYSLRTPNYECERSINLFPEMDEQETGKELEPVALMSVPGQVVIHTLPRSPIRAVYTTANGFLYVIAGNAVYNLTSTDGITFKHTIIAYLNTTTGPVSIVDGVPNYYNGALNSGLINQVVIVDGSTTGICFEEGTTIVTQMTSGLGYQGSNFVTFQDGYFLFAMPDSISGYFADDPINIDDLNAINVNLGSDSISRIISDHDIIWIFGNRSSSVWQNTGSSENTFAQIPGSFSEGGCSAPNTIQKVGGQLIWLSNDERGQALIYQAYGYRAVRISNHGVENALQASGNLSGATAWSYQDSGHTFYCLNIPGASTTWCFDLTTKTWSERAFFSNGQWSRDLIENHTNFYAPTFGSVHICGDYQSGNIYTLSNSAYTLNGVPIQRERITPHMSSAYNRVFYRQLQLDLEGGTGLDGLGYPLIQGTTGSPVSNTATNIPLLGNGHTFSFAGNDGSIVTPISPTISCSGSWSGSYSISGSQITINPGSLTIANETIGHGNGTTTSFSVPNMSGTNVSSYSIYVEDWRGNNIQSTTPVTNLCTNSKSFSSNTGYWLNSGVRVNGSTWYSTVSDTLTTYRPSSTLQVQDLSSHGSTMTGTITSNLPNAYSAGTSTLIKETGSYASIQLQTLVGAYSGIFYKGFGISNSFTGAITGTSLTVSAVATGSITIGQTLTFPGVLPGTLIQSQTSGTIGGAGVYTISSSYAGIASQTMTTSFPVSGNLYVSATSVTTNWTLQIKYQVDNSGNWITVASPGFGAEIYANNPVSVPISCNDISTLQVEFTTAINNGGTPLYANVSVYDVLFLQDTTTYSGSTLAPDGSNTGSQIIEDTSNQVHNISTTYTSTIGNPVTMSCYVIAGSSNRYIELQIGSGTTISAKSLFNINTGTIYSTTTGTASIVTVSTGLYRISVSGTELVNGNNTASIGLYSPTAVNDIYSGNGTSYMNIWGVQIQENSAMTPLIETSGVVLTDFISFSSTTGTLTFGVAPLGAVLNATTGATVFPAAKITGSFSLTGYSTNPVEYYWSGTYLQAAPNIVYIGTDPKLALSYSDDGGHTFSPERTQPIGKIGNYRNRAIWRRLGMSRDRVFKIVCSDPVKLNLVGCEIQATVGESNV